MVNTRSNSRRGRGRPPSRRSPISAPIAREGNSSSAPPAAIEPPWVAALAQQIQGLAAIFQSSLQAPPGQVRPASPSSPASLPIGAAGLPSQSGRQPSMPPRHASGHDSLPRHVQVSSRGAGGRQEERRGGKRPRSPSYSDEGSSPEDTKQVSEARRMSKYEKKLQEHDQLLVEIQKERQDPLDPLGYNPQPPFSSKIMREIVPKHFRMPQLEPFDGSTDPADHLGAYRAHMMVQGATDAHHCLAFPATLRKAARLWYSNLLPGSVHSFAQLEQAFLSHFRTSRRMPRTSDSLFTIQQEDGESLMNFLTRFNSATLEVQNLNDAVALSAMKKGLRSSRLTYSLDKKLPKCYSELLTRAYKYAQADEAALARRLSEKKPEKKKKKEEVGRPNADQDARPRYHSTRPSSPVSQFRSYTPLNLPREKILMEIEKESYLRQPKPLRTSAIARDQRRYCRFHRDHGHTTEKCFQLKNEIEGLIRRGFLGKYVSHQEIPAERAPPTLSQADAGTSNRPIAGVINTITRQIL